MGKERKCEFSANESRLVISSHAVFVPLLETKPPPSLGALEDKAGRDMIFRSSHSTSLRRG